MPRAGAVRSIAYRDHARIKILEEHAEQQQQGPQNPASQRPGGLAATLRAPPSASPLPARARQPPQPDGHSGCFLNRGCAGLPGHTETAIRDVLTKYPSSHKYLHLAPHSALADEYLHVSESSALRDKLLARRRPPL